MTLVAHGDAEDQSAEVPVRTLISRRSCDGGGGMREASSPTPGSRSSIPLGRKRTQLAGSTPHEAGRDDDTARRGGVTVHSLEQQAGGLPAQFGGILRDHRHTEEVGELE